MQKILCLFILLITILSFSFVDAKAANDDYKTFNEIILSEGKLLRYYTDEELEVYKEKLKRKVAGVDVIIINKNVEATYISETLYNVHNTGKTNIEYQLDISITKNEKISWEVSGDLNATAKGSIKMFQANIESKVGIDYKKVNENTEKTTEKLDLMVEPNSRAIIYLMGRARVTNGVACIYVAYLKTAEFGFEYFTIINQYPRLEKRTLC